MPLNWTKLSRAPGKELNPVKPPHQNPDGTVWVLVNTQDVEKLRPLEVRGGYADAAAAELDRPF